MHLKRFGRGQNAWQRRAGLLIVRRGGVAATIDVSLAHSQGCPWIMLPPSPKLRPVDEESASIRLAVCNTAGTHVTTPRCRTQAPYAAPLAPATSRLCPLAHQGPSARGRPLWFIWTQAGAPLPTAPARGALRPATQQRRILRSAQGRAEGVPSSCASDVLLSREYSIAPWPTPWFCKSSRRTTGLSTRSSSQICWLQRA